MTNEDILHGLITLAMKSKMKLSKQEKEAIAQIKFVLQRISKNEE